MDKIKEAKNILKAIGMPEKQHSDTGFLNRIL